ncbi:Pyrophosphate-energized vacuolar membrane proton pump [Hordeum vulgare]|nr:Pyrophosphate-energized vacuolar membrane proton pump [Hordeum vulgare]
MGASVLRCWTVAVRRPENLSFPITGPTDCESHREWVVRRGKEMIMVVEARITEEMAAAKVADAAARAAAEKEAICTRILKKQQRRNACALSREKNQAVREMVGLPPKVEKEVSDGDDSSGDE